MEVWGGIECTINRVADSYFDQLGYSGHYERPEDIDLFAGLGIKKMRYPILWEKHQPQRDTSIDWTFATERLEKLKSLCVQPIVGLVHHGSGPSWVNMLDDSFALGLADYAERVATQFPWINYYTPINEPLTTARFCGLYGFWFPHKRSDKAFVRILFNECKGTALAMQAIRKINPDARLVQTEDLGKIHSTKLLKYQADFENARRWLGFDLLCGKVTPRHKLWKYLLKSGLTANELQFFIDNPCPPDIMGFNHYLTSERYLDQNTSLYPRHTVGGNGKHRYADVEVVRVGSAKADGPYKLLKEAWRRFQLPLAITEVHLHCTREDQLRWVRDVWNAALMLEKDKIDIRGFTAWALLGSFGWNKLLTRPHGDYEPGLYNIVSGQPRPTALSSLIQSLANGRISEHPAMAGEGWWKHDSRVTYYQEHIRGKIIPLKRSAPLLIIGNTGTLGNAFARVCKHRNINFQLLGRENCDLTNPWSIEKIIKEQKPWAIINAAGYVRVDDAESEVDQCLEANAIGVKNLAVICERYEVKLLTFSSDLVFDGEKQGPYFEHDIPRPLNIYGHSKVLAEQYAMTLSPNALVIRTSAFFGPWDQYNFVWHVLNTINNKLPFYAAEDLFISPTYVPDLVNVSLDLLIDDERGIRHLANRGALSWYEFACKVAERSGCDTSLVIPVRQQDLEFKAKRPVNTVLASKYGNSMPDLEEALGKYFHENVMLAGLIHTA